MVVLITLLTRKPWRTSWKLILSIRRVSMIASDNFHSVSSRLIPWVLVLPLVMSTNIVHPRYVEISPCFHMYCVITTRFFHRSGFEGVAVPSAGYASLSRFLKCSAQRWVCPPTLFRRS